MILHCDLNNFFASVECVKNPDLRGKPVAVCGSPEARKGIVLAKSEEAKKMGIKTGMVIWEAKQKCPDLIIVSTHYDDYAEYSRRAREIYYRFTNQVESFGIDECWLDVTASQGLFGGGVEIADKIREVIKKELGLTVSVGVSFNKMFAKIGSDLKKPDATTEISRANFKAVVYPLPVTNLLFVGRKTAALLEKLNVKTIGDLAEFDERVLSSFIGVNAKKLITAARGEDVDTVSDFEEIDEVKSVGNGTTIPHDVTKMREVEQVIYLLSEKVAYRMRKKHIKGFTVGLSVKSPELHWAGAQHSIETPTNSVQTISDTALLIFGQIWKTNGDTVAPVRALRVSVSHLTDAAFAQLNFFSGAGAEDRNDRLSAVFDRVRAKHGTKRLLYGGTAKTYEKLGYTLDFEVLDE